MSDLVSVAAIKDLLTECPICIEHFDESTRIPRRMPCCVQSICQPCLETYTRGAATLSCPMCRRRHNLPGGVKSLPKETLILKTLDYLKIQKGLHLPCTDCPDKETAVAQCDNCGTFLCSLCLSAHKRNTVSKAHTINTFDEMKGRPVQSFRRLHQCSQHQQPLQFYCYTCDKVVCVSCTVVDHKEGKGHNVVSVNEAHQAKAKTTNDVLGKMEEKTKRLCETESALQKKIENIKLSMRLARDDINKIFDNLIEGLNQRRTILLSDVEGKSTKNLKLTEEALDSTRLLLTKVKSSSEYMRQMRSKADKVEDLQVMGSSEASLKSMFKESPKEIPFDRTGVIFVQANVKHLQDTIKVAGMVRSVTFSPTERPNSVPDTVVYNAFTLEPAEFPTVMEMDRSICDQEITYIMSDLVSVAAIKDLLTECPICTEHFDDATRIPRRMPCCVQSICQLCLETYTGGAATLSCPMCRHRHNLPGGVKSLPKETLILKTLDYLKIQKGLHLPCTDCPDKETAVAQCDNCGTFLCSLCLSAHKRNMVTKAHTINTFDEMKGRPVQSFRRLHQCSQHQQPLQFYCHTCDKVVCVSCTVVDHKEGKGHNVVSVDEAHQGKAKSTNDVLGKIEEKTKRLSETESALQKKIENIKLSMRVTRDDINEIFDNLTDRLNQRRTILLSDVEGKSAENLKLTEEALDSTRLLLTKVKSSSEYMRQMRSKADKVEDLQVMGSSEASLNYMLKESPKEIPFDRTGVTFVQANVKHLQDTIKVAGMVRSVTFSPTKRPNVVPDTAAYNAIILEPAEFPTVMEMDRSICDQEITCPTLEWDSSTANNNIDVSGCVITNTTPAVPSPDTGCRIQNSNSCLASRPLMVKNCEGQRCMCRVKFRVCVKELLEDNKLIQEIALTPTPVDAAWNHSTGLSVYVGTSPNHKQQLCLRVSYNNTLLSDRPLIQNKVGQSFDRQLYFLMDGTNDKILVIDAGDNTVYTTATDVAFDRPMWVMMYVGYPATSDVRGELITGHNITGTFANYNH
ncbi:uncharacterized protein LOC125371693 isoform X2 [Haliotis rufescens]|nr:uncharacterized protein LOC125371693 isoform X2 [Haliotis rufescens]